MWEPESNFDAPKARPSLTAPVTNWNAEIVLVLVRYKDYGAYFEG